MFDPERLLGQVMNGALGGFGRKDRRDEESNRGLSSMGGLGGFGGSMKMGAGLGLLGIAMAAFEHFKEQRSTSLPPPLPGSAPPPPPPPMASSSVLSASNTVSIPAASGPGAPVPALTSPRAAAALHLLRSMIAAAHADGQLDDRERTQIVGRARDAQLPPEDLLALGSELSAPRGLAQLLAETPHEYRRETYAAAVLAIAIDSEAERSYLAQLAAGLRLSQEEVAEIMGELGAAPRS